MSPLLVAQAPYDVKGVELGHSHFMGWQAWRMWAELSINGWIRVQFIFLKGSVFRLLFSFLSFNYGAYYCSKSKPIVCLNAVRCKFSFCLGLETWSLLL